MILELEKEKNTEYYEDTAKTVMYGLLNEDHIDDFETLAREACNVLYDVFGINMHSEKAFDALLNIAWNVLDTYKK